MMTVEDVRRVLGARAVPGSGSQNCLRRRYDE